MGGGGRGRKQVQTLCQLCHCAAISSTAVGRGPRPCPIPLCTNPDSNATPSQLTRSRRVVLMPAAGAVGGEVSLSVHSAGAPAGVWPALCHTQCTIGHQRSFSSAEIRAASRMPRNRVLLSFSGGGWSKREGEGGSVQWA